MTQPPRIAVLDYGIGNLRSAQKALERVGALAVLTTSHSQIDAADAVVLPGVGAFGACMDALRSADLEEFFKQRGYFYKKESPLLTRIVKAVFGNVDRRRISTYSLVLRSAQKEGIAAEKLSEWIEKNGGIQEIKLARSDSYVSPKAKAAQAKSTLSALPNLAVAKDKLAELADASYIGCECLLLAEQQSDGSFHIKALNRSAAAINAALASLYSEQQKAAA